MTWKYTRGHSRLTHAETRSGRRDGVAAGAHTTTGEGYEDLLTGYTRAQVKAAAKINAGLRAALAK